MREPSNDFNGKVALVTGAASGLGRGTAERLAQQGASVVLFDRNPAGLAETASSCRRSVVVVGDVTVTGDVARAVAVAATFGLSRSSPQPPA